MRDLVSQAISLILPILLPAIAAYVATLVRKYVHNDSAIKAFQVLGGVVRTCVASAAQTTVNDLKDPSKPGTWDKVAAEAVKASVVAEINTLGTAQLAALSKHFSPETVAKLVDHMVEGEVLATAAVPAS